MYFKFGQVDGRREKWSIEVSSMELLACCDERMSYHKGRVAFWEVEHAKSEKALRESGISLRSFAVTGHDRLEAKLDQGLANRVSECQMKVGIHKDACRRFAAFRSLIGSSPGSAVFELNVDDVLYFNLAQADQEVDGGE